MFLPVPARYADDLSPIVDVRRPDDLPFGVGGDAEVEVEYLSFESRERESLPDTVGRVAASRMRAGRSKRTSPTILHFIGEGVSHQISLVIQSGRVEDKRLGSSGGEPPLVVARNFLDLSVREKNLTTNEESPFRRSLGNRS